jgi:hypothetical protein
MPNSDELFAVVQPCSILCNSLCDDNTTTFNKDEIMFNGLYNDVWKFDDSDRENERNDLMKKISSDRCKKEEHPSKEFILCGGLKKIRELEESKKFSHKIIHQQIHQQIPVPVYQTTSLQNLGPDLTLVSKFVST